MATSPSCADRSFMRFQAWEVTMWSTRRPQGSKCTNRGGLTSHSLPQPSTSFATCSPNAHKSERIACRQIYTHTIHTHTHTYTYKFCTNVWWPWGSLKVLIITHNISQTLWNRSQPVYLIGQLLPGFLIVTKTKVKLLLLFIKWICAGATKLKEKYGLHM